MPRSGTLVGLSRVKNEGDIIEAFVRHNLTLLDHLVVVDNASSDGTRAILAELLADGLPLTILDDATFVYRQSEIMTYLARATFASLGCERVFLLDADEFLIARDRTALDAALADVPRETHVRFDWRTYVPTAADDENVADVLGRITHRRVAESVPESKIALSASFARDPSAVIAQGNHAVEGRFVDLEPVPLAGVHLAHFPVRGISQLLCKVLVGWNSYIAMGMETGQLAYQWRRAYESVVRDGGLTRESMLAIAAGYPGEAIDPATVALCVNPLPRVKLRYSQIHVADPVMALARALEQLSRQFARTTRQRSDDSPVITA